MQQHGCGHLPAACYLPRLLLVHISGPLDSTSLSKGLLRRQHLHTYGGLPVQYMLQVLDTPLCSYSCACCVYRHVLPRAEDHFHTVVNQEDDLASVDWVLDTARSAVLK